MLTRYIYSKQGIMHEELYEVFRAVIQFTQYTFIYVRKYIKWNTYPKIALAAIQPPCIPPPKPLVAISLLHKYKPVQNSVQNFGKKVIISKKLNKPEISCISK
jgi:hypothetical protein